jgi:DNA polymerase-4
MVSPRYFAHIDLDAFFVSVECILNPSLKGIPLIVGGHHQRGVVAACSYEARKFGIHSAMPMKTAMKLCPRATVVSGTRGEYSKYSRWVTEVIAAHAPLFEKASIDEFYLDLTGMDKYFDPYQWTVDLCNKITSQIGLPVSFGLATSKMVAKMATNACKPNGQLFIRPGEEQAFLFPRTVNQIPGVGGHTYRGLLEIGIESIKELAETNPVVLERKLGKYGLELWNRAHGNHTSEVVPYHEAKSVSTENTFDENTGDLTFLQTELVRMTEKVSFEMRQENKMAGCIAVKIRYHDFETTSRQTSIPYTCYDDELIARAKELFLQLYKKGKEVRLLGVRLSELTGEAFQTNLFESSQKKTALYKAIDDVKEKFGSSFLTKATGK